MIPFRELVAIEFNR